VDGLCRRAAALLQRRGGAGALSMVRPDPGQPLRSDRLRLGRLEHCVGSRTLVMGILNVTPDSFSDGPRFAGHQAALAQGRAMAAEGADIIDIGGESTRPGAEEVPAEEELRRIIPVIRQLSQELAVPISVDTFKATVAEAAIRAGAAIVNDVWGLQRDPAMAGVAAEHGVAVVAMHNRGHDDIDPGLDMVEEVLRFLDRSVAIALRAGIGEDRLVLDPGIGFGKSQEQNLELCRALPRLRALGFPVLLGISRKSTIGKILDKPVDQRLFGSLGANLVAVASGVDIIRVHDVGPHVEAVRVADAIARDGRASH
jgi:dihydropteroate synthase